MKLTQQDKARLLGIDARTLRKWRKEKPYLYEIIEKGFAFEEVVKKTQQNAEELKILEEQFKNLNQKSPTKKAGLKTVSKDDKKMNP
jgi:transposase-like protein